MHVLDPANVVNVINENPATQWLPGNIANQMPLVLRRINSVVGIEQLDVEDRRIFSAHGNCPRIRLRFFVWILLRIKNHHAL